MDRRRYLTACTCVATTIMAGCSELEGIENGSSDDIPGYHSTQLRDEDIGVTEVYRDDGDAIVEYRTSATSEDQVRSQVGIVATAIADAISDPASFQQGVDRVRVTGLDEDDTDVVYFSIREQWAIDFVEDELTGDEYLTSVYDTVDVIGFDDETPGSFTWSGGEGVDGGMR